MMVSFVSQRNLVIIIVKMIITLDTAVTNKTTVNLSSLWKVSLCDDALVSEAGVIGVVKEVVTDFDTDALLDKDDNDVRVVFSVIEETQ